MNRRLPCSFVDLARLFAACAVLGGTFSSFATAGYVKRGFGSGDANRIDGVNSNWYYNWGLTRGPARAEFVPMFWGGYAATDANVARIRDDTAVTTVLGFNEPERPDQANMSVQTALDLWPKLQATGKRLVSPAPSDTTEGRAWLQAFMAGAAQRNYQVDAVAFHWYGDVRQPGAASAFLSAVSWYHTTFNKPVWITEFGGVDWWGNPAAPVTMAQNLAFMKAVLPALDSRSYVERYAWWNWSDVTNLLVDPLPLTPTSLGDYWAGTTYATGQTFDMKARDTGYDIHYLKGGTITNTAPSGLDVMRRLDAVSGTSTITGAGRWDLADEMLRVRSGATLRKMGSSIIGLKGITVDNAGTIAVNEGTLQFEDGTTSTGRGTYRVETGATLAFATRTSASPNSIMNPIEMQGGTLRALNGTQIVAGNINFASASTLDAVGRLELTGILSGPGAVTKTGLGILRITNRGVSSPSGLVTVAQGTLFLDKFGSNVTGSSPIVVQENGTLAGTALINGAVTIQGTLSPGAPGTTGASELRFGSSLTLQAGSRTVVDLSAGGFDRLIGAGTITLGGTLQLLPSPSYNLATLTTLDVFSGAAVSGRFEQLEGVSLESGKALAVLYTPTSLRVMVALSGDATLDDSVGFDDLLIVAQNYESTNQSWIEGDFTGDTVVGFEDLLAVAQNYSGPQLLEHFSSSFLADWAIARSLVPEPVTAVPLLALMVVSRRGSRRERTKKDPASSPAGGLDR